MHLMHSSYHLSQKCWSLSVAEKLALELQKKLAAPTCFTSNLDQFIRHNNANILLRARPGVGGQSSLKVYCPVVSAAFVWPIHHNGQRSGRKKDAVVNICHGRLSLIGLVAGLTSVQENSIVKLGFGPSS